MENTITAPQPGTTPGSAIPAVPLPPYTIPVQIPVDLFNQLVILSNEKNISVGALCLDLVQKATNSELLADGTISDISDDAQELIKGLSYDAVLEALRIYNVAKGPALEDDAETPIEPGTLVFKTNSEVTDLVKQMNERRITKGLAPLENSICEVLFHYSFHMADTEVFEPTTGMKHSKFKATMKALALNEREANGAQSNIIDTASIFSSYKIVDTPVTETEKETTKK